MIQDIKVLASLFEAYDRVFDAKTGEIKPCGRDACASLIRICEAIDPDTDYGDEETGWMKPELIVRFCTRMRDSVSF